jgi:hypothetical protein
MKDVHKLKGSYEELIDGLDLTVQQKILLKLTWLDYLLLLDKSARRGWVSFNYSQLIVILFSLTIPVLQGSELKDSNLFGLTIISLLAFIVAALSALNRQLGFEGKWRHFRKNAEMVRNEGDDFLALSGNYQNVKNQQEAFKSFLTIITNFKRQEANSYLHNDRDKKKNENK